MISLIIMDCEELIWIAHSVSSLIMKVIRPCRPPGTTEEYIHSKTVSDNYMVFSSSVTPDYFISTASMIDFVILLE